MSAVYLQCHIINVYQQELKLSNGPRYPVNFKPHPDRAFHCFLRTGGAPKPSIYNFKCEREEKPRPLSHLLPRTASAFSRDFTISPIGKLVCRLLSEHKTTSNSSSKKRSNGTQLARPLARGGGGTKKCFIRRGSALRSNPLPFYMPFLTEKVSHSFTSC